MDSTFGVAGKEWVIIVCDAAVNRSIFTLKHNEDKITQLSSHKIMGLSGDQSQRYSLSNYIQRNLALKELRTGHEMGVESTAQYMRTEMAQALRRGPFNVNLLMGGYDHVEGRAKLYWMDYLGTLQQVNKGAQGYAGYFVNSVLDNNFTKDMTLDQGIECVKKCIMELNTRFMIKQHNYVCKIVTKDGVKEISLKDAAQMQSSLV